MKRRFIAKKPQRKIARYFSFFIVISVFAITFNILDRSKIELSDKQLVTFLLERSEFVETNESIYKYLKNKALKIYNEPISYLSTTNSKLIKQESIPTIKEEINTLNIKKEEPLIYIYNSHQTEEYAASTFLEYTVNPTVMISNYILEEQFETANYETLVEERSIKDILNNNGWKYSNSYKASRTLLEDVKSNNPTLKYFIDVHRDSLVKDKTTIDINDKTYAKILFIVGLENPNYEDNLKFTEAINTKLNEKYPNLSKGIYKKSGPGVNGVYNQDFSPTTILVEMGGYQNTPTEVMNSSLAFAECYLEVINTYEIT